MMLFVLSSHYKLTSESGVLGQNVDPTENDHLKEVFFLVHALALRHWGRFSWSVRPGFPQSGGHLTRPRQVVSRHRQGLAQGCDQLDQGDRRRPDAGHRSSGTAGSFTVRWRRRI